MQSLFSFGETAKCRNVYLRAHLNFEFNKGPSNPIVSRKEELNTFLAFCPATSSTVFTSGTILLAWPIKLCNDYSGAARLHSLCLRLFLFRTILCPSRRSLADDSCVEGCRDPHGTHVSLFSRRTYGRMG